MKKYTLMVTDVPYSEAYEMETTVVNDHKPDETPAKKKTATEAEQPAKKKRKSSNYLNNRDLLEEVIKSKEQGEMTEKLVKMLQVLCARYASRGNFASYSYNEDMQAFAMMHLVKTWSNFNPDKSDKPNPFAYYTQCVKNSYKQFLKSEKNEQRVRDKLLINAGLNPSYTYQNEHSNDFDDYEGGGDY